MKHLRCVGGPLDRQFVAATVPHFNVAERGPAPTAAPLDLGAVTPTKTTRYVLATIRTPDGPVEFWRPDNLTDKTCLERLLAAYSPIPKDEWS